MRPVQKRGGKSTRWYASRTLETQLWRITSSIEYSINFCFSVCISNPFSNAIANIFYRSYAYTDANPPTPTRIATSLDVYVAPYYYSEGLLPNPGGNSGPQNSVKQGDMATVEYGIKAADGTWPCGAVNWYIDNHAAGGYWRVSTGFAGVGCPAGNGVGGAGELFLYPNDTMKLLLGWHALLVDYPGGQQIRTVTVHGAVFGGERLRITFPSRGAINEKDYVQNGFDARHPRCAYC